jgi:hypothetical protein
VSFLLFVFIDNGNPAISVKGLDIQLSSATICCDVEKFVAVKYHLNPSETSPLMKLDCLYDRRPM